MLIASPTKTRDPLSLLLFVCSLRLSLLWHPSSRRQHLLSPADSRLLLSFSLTHGLCVNHMDHS